MSGRPALGISALPGWSAYTFCQVVERPVAVQVRVPDRAAVLGEVAVAVDGRQRERATAGAGRAGAARRSAAVRRRAAAAPRPAAARPARTRRAPQLDHPRPVVELGGDVQRPGAALRSTSTAAGSVALVLTTTRSPGCRRSGRSRAIAWLVVPAVTTAIRTWSRASPRASGGTVASLCEGTRNRATWALLMP